MSDLPELPARQRQTHKGDYGRVLVIAGSTGMTGAGALASRAALRSGAGLVTWALPKSLNIVAEVASPEVMSLPVPETDGLSLSVDAREHLLEATHEVSAVVLGPGLPVAGETGELLRLIIPEIHAPLVVDAGALRAAGREVKLFQKRKSATILTPHPGEMATLIGKSTEEILEKREEMATAFAQSAKSVVVLKGANTVVSDGEHTRVNDTGNPGMATGGTGDVLAGVLAGLLAQGMEPYDAAVLGVYIHGLAGDAAATKIGQHSLIASDIIDALPEIFLRLDGSVRA